MKIRMNSKGTLCRPAGHKRLKEELGDKECLGHGGGGEGEKDNDHDKDKEKKNEVQDKGAGD